MSFAHTLAKPGREAAVTVGRAHHPAEVTLNFGEVVSVVLTRPQLMEALAAIQADIDAHMAAHPVIARSA